MDEIKNIRTPPLVPQTDIGDREVGGEAQETWEFKTGDLNFNFRAGKIYLNKQDLAQAIAENLTQLSTTYWNQIAQRLELYRRWALSRTRDPEQLALFAALIQGLLGALARRLKRKLDETVDGMSFRVEAGALYINGINVHAFIEMARKNPNPKTKIFLKGLKNRLGIILANRFGNMNYEKIRAIVEELWIEIDQELAKSVEEVLYLPPASS